MRYLLLILLLSSSAIGNDYYSPQRDQAKYEAYKQRRADRRAYALDARRQMNFGKTHVYRSISFDASRTNYLQAGLVLPPIMYRPACNVSRVALLSY